MKSINIEPHWPTLLKLFEDQAKRHPSRNKRAMFKAQADEVRAYIAANPDRETCK